MRGATTPRTAANALNVIGDLCLIWQVAEAAISDDEGVLQDFFCETFGVIKELCGPGPGMA
jgi:hypothetical protein